MSDNSTTSIMDLPTDPANGGNLNNNMSMNASELVQQQNMNVNSNAVSLDQSVINQIVNGLQQANLTGATQLPSRDIPLNTSNLTHDVNIQPNYIPPPPVNKEVIFQEDYIGNYEKATDMINDYNYKLENNNRLDDMYNEIQVPLLLAVLYFLFQLPIFRKYMFTYLPFLFSNDGNLNFNGYIFMSALFGIFYYLMNKIHQQFGGF
uniref:Uncharacterized protein n=1 Tax=viral metagenome TaxID=1070528 RepID=A0A6C0DHY3_9ZZZZ